ncbi:MAG: TIGR03842 family LLM class F420-dependent oxidoreductase [Thermoleophilia bacterium]
MNQQRFGCHPLVGLDRYDGRECRVKFGVSVPADPPTMDQIDKLVLAEQQGFDHGWIWDTHILMQEYSPLLTLAATHTERLVIGSCVTNPVTRDPTVVASLFATLANLIGGDRLVCGIGRGDSAVRIRRSKPARLADLEEAIRIFHPLVRGEEVDYEGVPVRFPWATGGDVPIFLAAYGPKALALAGRVADGVVLQVADPYFVEWCIGQVRASCEAAGRDWSTFQVSVAAPSYVSSDRAEAREQLRWFGALVGNHVADILQHHDPASIPTELWSYVEGRPGYDYREHTRQNSSHADYVPDEIVDRFTVLGTTEECLAKLSQLQRLGVTEFNMYTSFENPERVIEIFGRDIIPVLAHAG